MGGRTCWVDEVRIPRRIGRRTPFRWSTSSTVTGWLRNKIRGGWARKSGSRGDGTRDTSLFDSG